MSAQDRSFLEQVGLPRTMCKDLDRVAVHLAGVIGYGDGMTVEEGRGAALVLRELMRLAEQAQASELARPTGRPAS